MEIKSLDRKTIDAVIEAVEKIDYEKVRVSELKELLRPLLTGFRTTAVKQEKGIYVTRMRKCNKPENIREVYYPPAHLAARGRVNDSGEAIFYASIGKGVPLFELDPNIGDTIAISTWKTTDEMLLNQVGYTKEAGTELKSLREFESVFKFREDMKNFGEDNEFVYYFFATQFIRKIAQEDSNRYKLTNAISQHLMAGDNMQGIFYPTVKMFGNSDNIALKADFVDSSMKLVSIEYVKIIEKTDSNFKYDTLDSATVWDSSGRIEWSGRLLGWTFSGPFERKFSAENGEWITESSDKDRLDPIPTTLIDLSPTELLSKYKNAYPTTAKIGEESILKSHEESVNIRFNLHYDFESNEKFLSCYIPHCIRPFDVAKTLVNSYDQFINRDKTLQQSIISSNVEKPDEEVNSDDLKDIKFIHIFSEDCIDINAL